MPLGNGFEQGGAQRRRKRQRQKAREQNRHRQRQSELLVDHAHRARHKAQRQKHRHQHQRDADNRARDLLHGLGRSFARRQPLLRHQPLHVFDHHNRVIDQNADGQHHAKHGHHVDREPQPVHHGEGSHQAHRHHNRRNQRVADVLQKQPHHQKDQNNRLQQGGHNLLNRDLHKQGRVVRKGVGHILREVDTQLLELALHCRCRGNGVGARRQLHSASHGALAIQPRLKAEVLQIAFHARHIGQAHGRAISIGAQNNLAKLLRGAPRALQGQHGRQRLIVSAGPAAKAARRHLNVLGLNGAADIGNGQAVAQQLG